MPDLVDDYSQTSPLRRMGPDLDEARAEINAHTTRLAALESGALVIVANGADPAAPRERSDGTDVGPATALWIGSSEPVNALDGDLRIAS